MNVGIGITTYNRPEYLKQCLEGIRKLAGTYDALYVFNDGSTSDYSEIESEVGSVPGVYYRSDANKGVAYAKNWLLKEMLAAGCDYLFLVEDDIIAKDPKAITEYIRLSQESGIEHWGFAHHGKANKGKLMHRTRGIDLYRNPIGAWCMYTRKVIEEVGFFDERFINAWEHVEHSWRVAKAGYTPRWGMSVADLTKSKRYLKEIPGSIENSSIRPRTDWMANNINGLIYWKQKSPRDFPLQHILDSLLREEDEEYKRLGVKNPRYI